jgi:hypothetical protein
MMQPIVLLAALAAVGPAEGGVRPGPAGKFPPNRWVRLKLETKLMPGAVVDPKRYARARGYYNNNHYGSITYRSATGEAIALDGWDGLLDGRKIGHTIIYANSLYGIDPIRGVRKQHEICRWFRGRQWEEHPTNRTNPTPLPRHVYGCLAYAPTTDSVYLYRGASRGAPPPVWALWAYSFRQGKWRLVERDAAKLPPRTSGSAAYENRMAYVPGEGKRPGCLYFFESQRRLPVWRLDLATETWSACGKDRVPISTWYVSHCVDTKRRRVLFCGGRESETGALEVWSYDVAVDRWRTLAVRGAKPPAPRSRPGICYLPALDALFLYGGGNHWDHWLLDLAANRWTRIASLTPPTTKPDERKPNKRYNQVYMIFDRMHDLIMIQHRQWHVLRLDARKLPGLRGRSAEGAAGPPAGGG